MDFKKKVVEIEKQGYLRKRKISYSPQDVVVKINNKKYISFASNDYLGLANNKKIIESFISSTKKYGVGSGSSSLISGYSNQHKLLEDELAKYLGFESVLVTNSGYLANVGLINAISNRNLLIFQDKENHNSIIESSRLSCTKLIRYNHLSFTDLEEKLKKYKSHKNKIIFTDSIFSMTGEIVDIKKISKLSKKYGALLFIDDAHGFCVMKNKKNSLILPNICSYSEINIKNIDAYVGTFGKAVGTFGSFIAGSKHLINLLIQKSRPYIYSTSLPPAIIESTRKSLKIIKNQNKLHNNLFRNINFFINMAASANLNFNKSDTPIQTINIGDPKKTLQIQNSAFKKGLFIQAIRYPSVPKGCDKIRISLTAKHNEKYIKKLIKFFIGELKP